MSLAVHPACTLDRIKWLCAGSALISNRRTRRGAAYIVIRRDVL